MRNRAVSPRTKGEQIRGWARANNVELAHTPHYASWLNRIEPQFKGMRYFCLAGTDQTLPDASLALVRAKD
jgi:hypothetical protein